MYNTAATIRQGAKTDTDAKILKIELSLNWTGPYKVLAVGPCSSADTPDGCPLGAKLLIWIYPPKFPTRMLAGAFRYNAASPVPTPRPWRHADVLASGVDPICAQQLLQEIPSVPRHSR